MNILLSIIGGIGFFMLLNEQPPGEAQNWYINLIGSILWFGAIWVFTKIKDPKRGR